jgi:hypothetical protein
MLIKEIITEASGTLYHATYKPFLDSIMKNGLGGSGAQTQWEDSKPGYVYLAKDPEVARSHAEANEEVPDEYIDDIVVLSIDTSQLDQNNLEDDPNVMDDDSTLAYKGVIPTSAFVINEDLRAWFGKGKKGGAGGGGWDAYNSSGERIGKCGDTKGSAKPKCLSKSAAAKLRNADKNKDGKKDGKAGIARAVKRKRANDPNKDRKGKAKNVAN